MKSQPKANYISNDVVMTPDVLAQKIVDHFKPTGKILEPCCGDGAFLRAMPGAEWCEIEKGRDFLSYSGDHVDWIVTNPPWSKIRDFLRKSMEVADNVVFLFTINHLWTKARIRMIREADFRVEEILLIDYPKEWPQSGFQLGVIHLKKGSPTNNIKFTSL